MANKVDINFLNSIGESKSEFVTVEKFGSQIEKVLYQFGKKISADLQKGLAAQKKYASGALASSIKFQVIDLDNGLYNFQLSLADYYKWVDEGRKPGKFPPPAAIQKWLTYQSVIAKLGQNYPLASHLKAGKRKHSGAHQSISVSSQSRLKSLAYLIGRKIAKKGIAPTNFYSAVVNENALLQLRKQLVKALKRDVLIQLANG